MARSRIIINCADFIRIFRMKFALRRKEREEEGGGRMVNISYWWLQSFNPLMDFYSIFNMEGKKGGKEGEGGRGRELSSEEESIIIKSEWKYLFTANYFI